MGFSKGVFSNILYIFAGLSGLPIFAGFGSGIIHLFGPTGGYIFGFVFAAGIAGSLKDKGWTRNFKMSLLLMISTQSYCWAGGVVFMSLLFLKTSESITKDALGADFGAGG